MSSIGNVTSLSITCFFRKLNSCNLQKTWKSGSFVGLNASCFQGVTPSYSYKNISNYQTRIVLLILHPKLILQ